MVRICTDERLIMQLPIRSHAGCQQDSKNTRPLRKTHNSSAKVSQSDHAHQPAFFFCSCWIRRRTMHHLRLKVSAPFSSDLTALRHQRRGHRCWKIDLRRSVRKKTQVCLGLRQNSMPLSMSTANGFADWLYRQQSVQSPASLVLKTEEGGRQRLAAASARLKIGFRLLKQQADFFWQNPASPVFISAALCPNSASCCCRLVQIRRSCAMRRQFGGRLKSSFGIGTAGKRG